MLSTSIVFSKDISVSGTIGHTKLTIPANEITGKAIYSVHKDSIYIAITEVYPEGTAKDICMDYTVKIPGNDDFHRVNHSVGFGKLTYTISLNKPLADNNITICQTNRAKPLIYNISGIKQADLDNLMKNDSFVISSLIHPDSYDKSSIENAVKNLNESLPEFPDKYNISKGISTELRFAVQPDEKLNIVINAIKDSAKKYKLKTILGLVSWWGGTPMNIPDEKGGTYGDVNYQQICYNPDYEFKYDAELQQLLGERYNRHYRKSIPNIWGNTPWLTMNNKDLNNFRYNKMANILDLINKADTDNSWINYIFIENEPKYWDQITDGSEITEMRLWADFNPATIEAAKADQIDLDPTDGLSKEELLWLHGNVARYNQEAADRLNQLMKEKNFSVPIYSHTLYQAYNVFPCNMLENKPASEWGYINGARTGLESCVVPMIPGNLYRVRDWGRWTNLNREESDGWDIGYHLWDLRTTYLCGGDYYNSYNSYVLGENGFANYVKDFKNGLPNVERKIRKIIATNDKSIYKLWLPIDMLSFKSADIFLSSDENVKGTINFLFIRENGDTISKDIKVDISKGSNTINLDLPLMAESQFNEELILKIYLKNNKGEDMTNILSLDDINLKLNIHKERLLSLYIINKS